MATVLESAAKGHRKAMMQLYENNKTAVYVTAELLLGNGAQATDVTAAVFAAAWKAISDANIRTEEEFTQWVLCYTVDACKARVTAQNSKAYRLPATRSFVLGDLQPLTDTDDEATAVTSALPPLQKLILILHTVCGFDSATVAKLAKLDAKTCERALADEITNVTALGADHAAVCETLANKKNYVMVPSALDTTVAESIGVIANPLEKKQRGKLWFGIAVAVLCAAFVVATAFGIKYAFTNATTTSDNGSSDSDKGDSDVITKPVIDLDKKLTYFATIDIKDYGKITVELDHKTAPVTVANFVNLAQEGFYDGLTFHRIMEGFMMQGGDPEGTGFGGADHNIVGEFSENGYKNDIKHKRGVISMARSTALDSASSQFFIMHEDKDFLDGKYAAFGHVTEGMDVVDAVCEAAKPTDDNGTIPAAEQPIINSITITTQK